MIYTYVAGKGVFRDFLRFDSGLLMTAECYKRDTAVMSDSETLSLGDDRESHCLNRLTR